MQSLQESIFFAIELGKLAYCDIMNMPLYTLHSYIKWKLNFDQEVAKLKEEQLEKIQSETRTKFKQSTFK